MSISEDSGDGFDELREIVAAGEGTDVNTVVDTVAESESPKKEGWTKSEEEKRLEKLLFGDKDGLIESLAKGAGEDEEAPSKKATKRKPVWQDDDDINIQVGEVKRETKYTGPLDHLNKEKSYKEYLVKQFDRVVAAPKWADLDREREVDSDEEILQTVGFLAKSTSTALPPNNLHCKKLKDLNRATYAEGSVTSVQFHPTSTVGMVAGKSGVATLYAIDGLKNEKLHNMRFKNFKITCAKLYDNGNKAVFGGSNNFYYTYDLLNASETCHYLPKSVMTTLRTFETSPCGKYLAAAGRFGEIHLLHLHTFEVLHTFKQESHCTALKFSPDSSRIFAHSKGADVTIFNLKQQRPEHIFLDDGCIVGRTLDISANSAMLATGSNEGVVNVYNYADVLLSKAPKPQKVVYNLTTGISNVRFNHSSEVLGMCSDQVAGAVKLLHVASGTVFANFPGYQNKLPNISSIEFSPASGFMALGSNAREVSLFRLKHFKNY